MSTRPSRETILERFRACTRKLGRTPGRDVFTKITGITAGQVDYYWPRHSDLVREAGVEPNVFNPAAPENEIFEHYGRICLHLKKIPTSGELRIAARELGTRNPKTFYSRFGSFAELDKRFRAWLEQSPAEFRPILGYDGWRSQSRAAEVTPSVSADAALRPFLPACLLHLEQLASGVNPAPDLIENVAHEFERRSGDAFRCLGFDVQQLGQGRGRKADFLALARQDDFAVICDAKARGEGYVLGTEDRKFLEYAVKHTRELHASGLRKVYLIVLGPAFRNSDLDKLTKYLADSPLRSVDLVTARALMRMVEDSIRDRFKFRLSEVDQALFGNKVIAE